MVSLAIQALGGPAFLNFKSMETTGRVFFFENGQTAGLEPYQSTDVPPDKRRFKYGKGKPVILINSGGQGWEIDRYGIVPQPPKEVEDWRLATRYNLENLFRLRIHEPGVLIQTNGVDFVSNQPVDVLTMTDARQVHLTIDLHRPSHLPIRIAYRIAAPNNMDWDEYADNYSDYRVVQGIATPMHVARMKDGERIGEAFRNTVHYNEPVPPNYFQPSQ